MSHMIKNDGKYQSQQQGAAAVEFAIVALLLFTILFGILELGRLFYVYNTVQEVTRHAAREAVVRWVDNSSTSPAKVLALFGAATLPGGAEITATNIDIQYLTASGSVPSPFPASAADNIAACLTGPGGCIAFVQVSIIGASYVPMVGLFPFLSLPIPASTVTMPAESLGYTG